MIVSIKKGSARCCLFCFSMTDRACISEFSLYWCENMQQEDFTDYPGIIYFYYDLFDYC